MIKKIQSSSTSKNSTYRSASDSPEKDGGNPDAGLLSRGLAILETLIKEERPLTCSELAEMVGLNSSTTHRLLQTLLHLNYISRDTSKRYLPTARSLFPMSLYHPLNALRRLASEELRNLQSSFRMTAALQIFIGHQRVVLEICFGLGSFSPYYEREVTTPLHASSSGKLLLYGLSESERYLLLGDEPYQTHASGTMVTKVELERDFDVIAERGYSVTMDEMLQGLAGVAAPIWLSPGKPIGAIVISLPSPYFQRPALENIAGAAQRSAELFAYASPDIRAVARSLGL